MNQTLDLGGVKSVFASYTHQDNVLLGLYKLVLPDWDRIDYIVEGKPHIGEEGWREIFMLFQAFDQEHHGAECILPGGLWLNLGFIMDKNLGPWEVDTSRMKIAFKPGQSQG